jgi:hypothetical protein
MIPTYSHCRQGKGIHEKQPWHPPCLKVFQLFMNIKTIIGIVLITLGVVSLAYKGFTYKSREKVVDMGPLQATMETDKQVPPIYGIIVLVLGVVVLVVPAKSKG